MLKIMRNLFIIFTFLAFLFCNSAAAVEIDNNFKFSQEKRARQLPAVVEAKNHAVLSSQREGMLVDFKVDTGDRVKKGDFLATIFHEDLILESKIYNEQKQYWKFQIKSLKDMYRSGVASDTEIAKASLERNLNEIKIKITDNRIKQSKIFAPFSGIIIKRHIRPFEWVKPGQPVLELYNPDKLCFTVNIPSNVVVNFKVGQKYLFFVHDLNRNIAAKLTTFEPKIDVHSSTIKTYWLIYSKNNEGSDIREKLLPGMKGVMKVE
jgi:membrane fusion protein, multidrug efflux system